jgi:hypothetical protein
MDIKELLIVFFYNQIKRFAEGVLGTLGIPIDYVLLAIGYWKKDTWWGRGLLYGAVASLGGTLGAQLLAGLPLPGAQTQTATQRPVVKS